MTLSGQFSFALLVLLFFAPAILSPAGGPLHQESANAHHEQSEPKKKPVELIDINQASEEDFARLPGIGPELARRIVAFRNKHGPFRRVEDLLAIRGIGHKKWKAIRPYLRVGDGQRRNAD